VARVARPRPHGTWQACGCGPRFCLTNSAPSCRRAAVNSLCMSARLGRASVGSAAWHNMHWRGGAREMAGVLAAGVGQAWLWTSPGCTTSRAPTQNSSRA
jgi:hypothetical protein